MDGSSKNLAFRTLVPKAGYRWVFCDENNYWSLRDPADDWPDCDYEIDAFESDEVPPESTAGQFYIAASAVECDEARRLGETPLGILRNEPELYLQFASERPTPGKIYELANLFGLLSPKDALHELPLQNVADILGGFEWDIPALVPEERAKRGLDDNWVAENISSVELYAEPASEWICAFRGMGHGIEVWSMLRENDQTALMAQYLRELQNVFMEGGLSYEVFFDQDSELVEGNVVASSLGNLVDVQWAMSIAADVNHRQCAECPKWFSVHPGSGRPEKLFCSDACRMRAYRKRKNSPSQRLA